jgi:superfamily II DNA or RNA helicase
MDIPESEIQRQLKIINEEYNFNYEINAEQMAVINSVVKKPDTVAVLPAGFGNTFCVIAPILILNKR